MRRLLLPATGLLAVLASLACPSLDPFACADDDQCTLSADGLCHASGVCSYPDDACPSGRRYSGNAGPLAGQCVDDDLAPTGTSGSSGGSASASTTTDPVLDSSDGPQGECGNGVVEGDEECDAGEGAECGACTPECRLAATVTWSAVFDAPGGRGSFFDDVLVDGNELVAVGRTIDASGDANSSDRLLVRFDPAAPTATPVDSFTGTRPGRDDLNCVIHGSAEEILVLGFQDSMAGENELWLGRWEGGEALPTVLAYGDENPAPSRGLGCALMSDGRLALVGAIDGMGSVTDYDRWDRLIVVLDPSLSNPTQWIVRGTPSVPDQRDLVFNAFPTEDGGLMVGGNVTENASDGSDRWLARFDAAGGMQAEWVDGGAGNGQEEVSGLAVRDPWVIAAGAKVFNAGNDERTWIARFTLDGLRVDFEAELPIPPKARVTELALDPAGGVLLVAETDTTAVLAKVDDAGVCQWMVHEPAGALQLAGVTVGPDGQAIIVGSTAIDDAGDGLVATLAL